MRLKYEKRLFINKNNSKKKTYNLKSTSIDNNIQFPSRLKIKYINKIPQKNLNSKLPSEKTYLKNNITNIQNNTMPIEEKNKKNKNYLINYRNQNNQSFKNYSNSNLSSSYNSIQRKTYEILDNCYLKNYYISRIRENQINDKRILSNSAPKIDINNIDFIKTNKISKYKDDTKFLNDPDIYLKNNEPKTQRQYLNNISINNNINIKNVKDFNNMFNKNISLLKPSKKSYNFIYTNKPKHLVQNKIKNLYEEEFENNGLFIDSDNNQLYLDNFHNSGRYEFPSDYPNESYLERFKYNLGKFNNVNSDKNIINGINFKNIKKNKSNNNSLKYSNKPKQYSPIKYFNNLKIENKRISIHYGNKMNNINLQNITTISGSNFYIQGNGDNNKIKASKVINNKDLENITKINKENESLKEKIDIINAENRILKDDKSKLNEEVNNLKNEILLLKNINQTETNDKNQELININDNNKKEIDKLIEENSNIKIEKDSLITQIKFLQEQKLKLQEDLNNLKKDDEIKNEQFNLMNTELSKLKQEINEEFITSKTNLEKLNEDFIDLKKENKKYKENLELLEEEKEIEMNQKQKLLEENKILKLQQIQLNEQIENLQEENEELENTANIKDEFDQLLEEYNNYKKDEKEKYNKLTEEKNLIKEELDKLKNKYENKKEKLHFPQPVIIKRNEKRRPSKFKKNFSEINELNNDEINENSNNKVEEEKGKINKFFEGIKNNISKEGNNEENDDKNIHFNEIKHKSVKIKNMAELLESHMHQNEIKDNNIKKIKEVPFDNMFKILQNQERKLITKRKMAKKNFEDS